MSVVEPWASLRANIVSVVVGLLGITLFSSAHGQGAESDRPATRNERTGCLVVPIVMAPRVYEQTEPTNIKSPRSETPMKAVRALYKTEPGLLLDRKTCEAFDRGDESIIDVGRGYWIAREDFAHPETFERIHRWTTRYAFDLVVTRAGPYSEIGDERLMDSGFTIEAYRVDNIRRKLHLFTPDGHWLDQRDGYRRWELRRSPLGRVWVIDPTRKYLAAAELFHWFYMPRCQREADGLLTCGLAQWKWQGPCLVRVGTGDPRGCLEYAEVVEQESPVFPIGPMPYATAIEVKPNRVEIGARQTTRAIWSLSLYANFSDPIRPVIFKPGVLYQPHAKPRRGRPRASDLVMREVCLADCPEQIVHQRPGP